MGSPVSPIIADIFMEDFEDRAFAAYPAADLPRVWKRFVDVIAVVKKDRGQPLLQHLNSQHRRIKFTMEEEKDGTLPFMDVRFTRDVQGKLMRSLSEANSHKPLRSVRLASSLYCEGRYSSGVGRACC